KPPPDALLSQYLPIAHLALRDGLIQNSPAELAMAHVCAVLDAYHAATFAQSSWPPPDLIRGSSRPSTPCPRQKDVDARDKLAHDGEEK
ncbi:MAG: hypothetical protein WBZ51_32890, partial [Xanthobacteraceae bacterium]